MYKSRREERLCNEFKKQKESVRSPEINHNSRQMVDAKYSAANKKTVSERLYEDHRKRQIALDMKQKLIEKQAQSRAQPNIHTQNTNQQNLYEQNFYTTDSNKVVNRLMGHHIKMVKKENVLKAKYDDKECTFQPKINTNSKKYASQMAHGMPLEFRNSIDVSKYHSRSKIQQVDENCTFKPTVSHRSKQIADARQHYENQPQNVFQRLISNRAEEDYTESIESQNDQGLKISIPCC